MQIQHATPTLSIRDIGQFTIKSGAIRFTDPCYANDTWCKGSMPAANGAYQAQIGMFRDDYDARNLRQGIERFKFAKAFAAKYNGTDYRYGFQNLVSQARDHGNWGGQFQKYHKVLELIAEIQDEEKRAAYEEMANYAIEHFSAQYTTKEECYWNKDLWVLFEMSGGLSCDAEVTRFGRGAGRLLHKIKDAQDNDEYTKEERDAMVARLEEYLKEETLGEDEAFDKKIKELQTAYDEGRPHRTHYLRIKHESVDAFTPLDADEWTYNNKFNVGVDSGQAGFFDENWFTEYANERKDPNARSEAWEKIYDMLCGLSSDGDSYRNANNKVKEQGGTFEFGANSYTAHGDGSAPMFYRLNESGEVIEAVYAYDVKDEEDEEDEDE